MGEAVVGCCCAVWHSAPHSITVNVMIELSGSASPCVYV